MRFFNRKPMPPLPGIRSLAYHQAIADTMPTQHGRDYYMEKAVDGLADRERRIRKGTYPL